MKTLEDYMNMPYAVTIVPDEDGEGYVAYYPELKGCITTGETIEDAVKNANDAKRCWISACIEDNIEIPEPLAAKQYSGNFKLRMPASLHKHLAERAAQEGISMNMYCTTILAKYA